MKQTSVSSSQRHRTRFPSVLLFINRSWGQSDSSPQNPAGFSRCGWPLSAFSYQLLGAASRDTTGPFPALQGEAHEGRGGWHRAHNPLCPPPFPPARGAQGAGHSTAESCCVQPRAPQHRNDLREGPAEGHKGDQGSGAL